MEDRQRHPLSFNAIPARGRVTRQGERHDLSSRDLQGDRKGPLPSTSSTPALTMTTTEWGIPFIVGAAVAWSGEGTLAVALVQDTCAKK